MTLSKGVIEMLQAAGNGSAQSFSDFTELTIGKNRLSSATVAKRLKELVVIKALEETIIRSKTGRKMVGYQTTERGRKILALAQEFEKAMAKTKMR